MAERFDLYKEEYIALRAEILQSIAKQHQITLAGYALTGAIVGAGYTVTKEFSMVSSLAIPLVLLAMTALWVSERNRNIRASYYIGYFLWPELLATTNERGDVNGIGWES